MKYKTHLGLLLAVCVALLIVVLGFMSLKPTPVSESSSIKHFNSYDEIESFLKAGQSVPSSNYYNDGRGTLEAVAPAASSDKAGSTSAGSTTHSSTNVQVEGVDEADIVKNDGNYIYTVTGNNIIIVDAKPAENMHIVNNLSFSHTIRNILVNGNKLIVFGDSYGYISYPEPMPVEGDGGIGSSKALIRPCGYGGCGGYSSQSVVYVYDISDKSNPELDLNMSSEGSYVESRMIGNYVYLINSQYANINNPQPPIYTMNGMEEKIAASDVYYFDYSDSSYVFTSLYAINVNTDDVASKVYLTGSTGTVFVSENNIYLTAMKAISTKDYYNKLVNEVYIPLLPNEEKAKVKDLLASSDMAYQKFNTINGIVQDYSLSLRGSEKEEFDRKLFDAQQNFADDIQKETEKTVIHKIHVDGNHIEYTEQGEVPGHVLNQFSLDEYKGNLRIATTSGNTWEGKSSNNFYILDGKLTMIGKVENLAKGESIYSARFLGDRAYLVTFKSVDPLFVIDAHDPRNPKVLGYLKIPGYSNYLHPYDENHVIGIGKEVNESIDADKVHSPGAVYYTAIGGVKVSLFDVSDVEHPKEQAKIVLGERGSESIALQDHKAVLFDKQKGILVLPVLLAELNTTAGYDYSQPVWQGAIVLNVDTNDISERGRITHFRDVNNTWDWYNDQYSIKRSLYIGDTLYTLSSGEIKANTLDDLREISSVKLPYDQQIYYGYGGGIAGVATTGPKQVEG
ncbi:beta-propeller domain-containing protein [Candidatus Pacearchaeota archaeon]|nr:beta-propeller domain-containing protein [Candidatus Pacearchaeota archaeon]